jgi:hypothetical protein
MKSLPLVLCVVALLGAASSAVLYFRIGNSKRILETQLTAARARGSALDRQLAVATEQNTALEKHLAALDSDLGETKSRLTLADARNVQLTRELTQTKSLVAAHDQAEHLLGEQIESLKHDLADARAAAVPSGTIEAYKNTVAELERQLAEAKNGAAAPAVSGASTAAFATHAPASSAPDLRSPNSELRILTIGPSNAFVVLNYGARHGAQNGQTLAIVRGTDPVASVLISDVRPNFSVAQVVPDSLRGVLHKGDSAVLTN